MIYYLDTNVLIHLLRKREDHQNVLKRLTSYSKKDVKIPAMVKAELVFGAYKCRDTESKLDNINEILSSFEIIPFDDHAAISYGKIRADLESKGITIGHNDFIIAATVMSNGGTLVTNNTKEFGRIDGLQIEDWMSL